jgi:UDP-N-acetyl-2-amino-2-deoxyglucuronate dehydrogenase
MNFALTGVAGYIAPRHMRAIKETGNDLVVALDPNDSVGIIDSYFPDAAFFTEFERFDRHVEKLRRGPEEKQVDYVSICSPNYLHDAHVRFALRVNANAICEKPLVLEPWNVDALAELEAESSKSLNAILQLRLHPSVRELREQVLAEPDRIHDIDLTYITARGRWYLVSWKGDEHKSGGVVMNIGVHFFDMLQWIFGSVERNTVHLREPTRSAGYLELKRARVRWFLSVDGRDLPPAALAEGSRTYRMLKTDDREFEFSKGFTDLHTRSYEEILESRGFGPADVRPSIELVHDIRNAPVTAPKEDYHPMALGS